MDRVALMPMTPEWAAKERERVRQEEADFFADVRAQRRPRTCLRCDSHFDSVGPQNRLCTVCLAAIEAMGALII